MQTLKLLLLSFILVINCFAQQKDTLVSPNPLKMYKWAVQFEVGNDFTLQSFDGLIISLKYHFTPKFSVRLGIGGNIFHSNDDEYYREYNSGLRINQPVMYDSRNYLFNSNVLYCPNPGSILKVYFGAGPRASYSYRYSEGLYSDFDYWEQYEVSSWSVGVNAVFGCEWFPLSFLSLFGEYSAFATYGEGKYVRKTSYYFSGDPYVYSKSSSKDFMIRGNIARLGASFYF